MSLICGYSFLGCNKETSKVLFFVGGGTWGWYWWAMCFVFFFWMEREFMKKSGYTTNRWAPPRFFVFLSF